MNEPVEIPVEGTTTITERELAFLRRLRDEFASQGGWALCRTNPPGSSIQGLVDRGYCKLSAARSGPLGLATGEVMVGLSEAGRTALEYYVPRCSAPQHTA
jgi:hypothetical protein